MLPFIPGGLFGRRKVRVCKRAASDAYHRWNTLRFPSYRRSKYAAELESDVGTAVRPSSELGW
jgi:hypothetical protein